MVGENYKADENQGFDKDLVINMLRKILVSEIYENYRENFRGENLSD
jgi:hypothetical protein